MAITIDSLESFDDFDAWQVRSPSFNSAGLNGSFPRTGTQGLRITGGGFDGNYNKQYAVGTTLPGVGFWLARESGGLVDTSRILYLMEGLSSTIHIYCQWNNDDLDIKRGDNTLLATAAGIRPGVGSGIYITLWVEIHNSTGAIKMWVNDDQVVDVSGIDTQNGGTGLVLIQRFGGSLGSTMHVDDVVMARADSFADAANLECNIETDFPEAQGTHNELMGSDGNTVDSHLLVDDNPASMTDYVGGSTGKQTFVMTNIPQASGTVLAFMVSLYARKSAAGPRSGRPYFRRSGVDGNGADLNLSTLAAYFDEVFQVDPTDASALSITKINDLEVGAESRP